MRPFLIDDKLKKEIKRIVEFAGQHVYSHRDITAWQNKQMTVPGDMKEHTAILPFGYKVVYSIVENNGHRYRIMSVSVNAINKLPNPLVVTELLQLTGFKNDLKDCFVTTEEYLPNMKAVKVMEEFV